MADRTTGSVYVRALPGGALVQTLSGFLEPYGDCTDTKGDVYITDYGTRVIREYAHGAANPIRILTERYRPWSCAVDPLTGDLAAANATNEGSRGIVAIYSSAKGRPVYRFRKGLSFFYCAYDSQGNLFLDGLGPSGTSDVGLVELRKGQSAFTTIALNQSFTSIGGLAWRGTQMAVGDPKSQIIYSFKMSGQKGVKTGGTLLTGSGELGAFSIANNDVYVPAEIKEYQGVVRVYHYPAGGRPYSTWFGFALPTGVAVSTVK
ncbi:MAG: hypothetical protein WB609_08915 [Candidatus Cybelea sp.]